MINYLNKIYTKFWSSVVRTFRATSILILTKSAFYIKKNLNVLNISPHCVCYMIRMCWFTVGIDVNKVKHAMKKQRMNV